jgi:hypothetical protein
MGNLRAIFFFIILLLVPLSLSGSEKLSFQYGESSLKADTLYVPVSLTGDFSFDTIDAVRNGITVKLFVTYQISNSARFLGRSRTTFSETIESFDLFFDVWENTYVLRDNRRRNKLTAHTTGEILEQISAVIAPLAFNLSSLEPSDTFYVRARIKIQTIKLFPPLGFFLLFFDPWNFESEWVQTDVTVR